MSNIEIYKPPILAIIEQETKLREMPSEERLMKCTQIVANLLLDLGVGSKSDPQQHLRVIKFLADDCGSYTVKEVEYAFKLAIKGELGIELFQQVNVLVVGKVLKAFDNHKIEKLRNFRSKKLLINQEVIMTEQEKLVKENDIVKRFIETFISTRIVEDEYFYVYDILDNRGFMNKDLEYKKKVKEDAIYLLNQKYNDRKASSKEEHQSIKASLKSIKLGHGGEIKSKCKILALDEFFRNLCRDESKLKEFKFKF
jgi:hypothetical protein